MAFRRQIPQEKLAESMTPEQRERHETVYQPSRGGWHREPDKPVPGRPKPHTGQSGR
ncbi:hypothetical protein [Streptomyces boncukensis]|uniref:Uncharacterized protein n=1 Tax=Streptomyces boncukensis TaxID=2711219 RepID=A0A6G4X189_9ACTN|nr:hypothetical protein [Streptomyces boncukensis]NGO70514.1 hypothetical protein [Streptomyces boncukensis]